MLQIITGKFYNSEDRFHNDCKGILYSNASFKGVYDIGHIIIESAESFSSVAPYIVMYDNQLQRLHRGFELVKVGDEETVEKIKGILIKDEYFKLSKRFQEFVVEHIGEDFFNYNEKRKIVGKEEFRVALVNAYNIIMCILHIAVCFEWYVK